MIYIKPVLVARSFLREATRGVVQISVVASYRSHAPRGNGSVDTLRPVPQERHNCIPTLERGNDS